MTLSSIKLLIMNIFCFLMIFSWFLDHFFRRISNDFSPAFLVNSICRSYAFPMFFNDFLMNCFYESFMQFLRSYYAVLMQFWRFHTCLAKRYEVLPENVWTAKELHKKCKRNSSEIHKNFIGISSESHWKSLETHKSCKRTA